LDSVWAPDDVADRSTRENIIVAIVRRNTPGLLLLETMDLSPRVSLARGREQPRKSGLRSFTPHAVHSYIVN
jgi:hypothetical protein